MTGGFEILGDIEIVRKKGYGLLHFPNRFTGTYNPE